MSETFLVEEQRSVGRVMKSIDMNMASLSHKEAAKGSRLL
jgi:hypothetical protein